MRVAELLEAVQQLLLKHPDAELFRNAVGNLIIVEGNKYLGFLDLRTGEIEYDNS